MTDTQIVIAAGVAALLVLLLVVVLIASRRRGGGAHAAGAVLPEPEAVPDSAPAVPELPKHTTWAEDAELLGDTELPIRTAEQIAAEAGPAEEPASEADQSA